MTKPVNFPERKRQRQIKALSGRRAVSDKGNSNETEIAALKVAVARGNQRLVKTKKDRSGRGKLFRAA